MAQITGQAGVNLTQELATYLNSQQGNLTSEQLTQIINQYLTGGDKLGAQGGNINTGIYKRFGEFDQVTGKVEIVTTGMWSGDTGSLNSYFTASSTEGLTTQTSDSKNYYVNVYNLNPSSSEAAAVQFAIAYGHKKASGSVDLDTNNDSKLATKATYAQYRSILLEQDDEYFTFYSSSAGNSHDSSDIYVINVARARYKEKMDAGNWELTISGSNGISTLIDDSGKKFSDSVGKAGRVFYVGSGSLNLGQDSEASLNSLTASNGQGFGLFYPDQGLIVLNPQAIHSLIGNSKDSGSVGGKGLYSGTAYEGQNHFLLYNAIKGGSDFEARRTENVSTSHYFVRATNREFNFSNNPTFVTGSDGTFAESTFERDPKTFITTIGLYNDANEMIAVAKTSQPIPKSFDKEVLIKVKLDF
jgi:hypothetical protein